MIYRIIENHELKRHDNLNIQVEKRYFAGQIVRITDLKSFDLLLWNILRQKQDKTVKYSLNLPSFGSHSTQHSSHSYIFHLFYRVDSW